MSAIAKLPPPVSLTPEQAKAWDATRAALVWHCPAFTHLFYSMMNKNGYEHIAYFTDKDDVINTAATDGQHLLINVNYFFKQDLQRRIFIVAHEISHAMFGHCELAHRLSLAGVVKYPDGKELSYDQDDMNRAMDYVINDMLIDSKVGQFNTEWLHDTTIATHMDDVLTAYRRIHQDKAKGGSSGKPGTQFDKHMKPGTSTGQDPTQATNSRNQVEWNTAIAGAIASAAAQGKLPGAMNRAMSEQLTPKVTWTDKVIGFFARKPGGGSFNWRSPDRRLITRNIIAPGRSGFGCGDVVVAVDTSGSITDKMLNMFFGEMSGILDDIRPYRLWVMFCDAQVHHVEEVRDMMDLQHLSMKKDIGGGGGTSFVPVFNEVQSMGITPDALIYFTDGYGSFPQEVPEYPTMWGSITPGYKYPFGEVVDVPV